MKNDVKKREMKKKSEEVSYEESFVIEMRESKKDN